MNNLQTKRLTYQQALKQLSSGSVKYIGFNLAKDKPVIFDESILKLIVKNGFDPNQYKESNWFVK